jgi:hypothetical protein
MRSQPYKSLGRLPSRHDPRTLRLANFRRGPLLPFPTTSHWDTKITDWGVMGNDTLGNCVIATAAHAILTWRANELDDTRRITDGAVIELSDDMGALNGYNILDRLKYWRKEGMWSNKLWAFAMIDATNPDQLKEVINTFGVADIGINLPNAWRDADEWKTGRGPYFRPGSWGSHSVPFVGYDEQHAYAVSWGRIFPITWEAIPAYVDEAYALIDPSWLEKDAVTPCGYNLPEIATELYALQAA